MYLRKITESDNGLLRHWRNDNAEFFPAAPKITAASQRIWYENYLRNPVDQMFLVCAPDPVGTVAINVREREIHRVMRGKDGGEPGAMAGALTELMNQYDLETYWLHVIEGNERALNFYKKLGFVPYSRCTHKGTPMLYMVRGASAAWH